MSVSLSVSGVVFPFPTAGDTAWANQVTNWATAVSASALWLAGGTFTLAAEVDWGANFGHKSLYYKTRTANIATGGQIRLARTDVVSWRSQENAVNIDLGVNSSNQLTFGGTALGFSTQPTFSDSATIDMLQVANDVSASVFAGSLTNTHVNASAAIALTKLAATTASRALVSDGSGFITPATTTATEIGFVNGVTSAIQTQLNTKITSGAAAIVNADVHAAAAIALTKLAATTASRALVSDGSGFISPATTTAAEIGFVNGVTSAIQTQLNTKITSGAAAIVNADVHAAAAVALTKLAATTVSRALVSDGSGFISPATTTAAEIGFVNGVTSAIQTQLNTIGLVALGFATPAAASTVDFTSGITGTYAKYLLVWDLIVSTDDVELWVRTDSNGGASFDAGASDYGWSSAVWDTGGGISVTDGDAADSELRISGNLTATGGIGNAAGEGTVGFFLFSVGSATSFPRGVGLSAFTSAAGTGTHSAVGGTRLSAAAINAIRVFPESGTITGTISLFGIRMS